MPPDTVPAPAPRRRRRWIVIATIAVLLVAAATAYVLRGGPATQVFAPDGPDAKVVAVLFSGDMGLRFGMGPVVARTLAQRGIVTVGKDSATLFRTHRSRAEVDAIVRTAIRATARAFPDRRIVLIGQSFGSDILATALPSLSAQDRARVAGAILVVPAQSAYFRADALGAAYLGTPDAEPAAGLRTVDWTPIACIQGALETDSLCPAIKDVARVAVLPGGHFLRNDTALLTATIERQMHAMVPGSFGDGAR